MESCAKMLAPHTLATTDSSKRQGGCEAGSGILRRVTMLLIPTIKDVGVRRHPLGQVAVRPESGILSEAIRAVGNRGHRGSHH